MNCVLSDLKMEFSNLLHGVFIAMLVFSDASEVLGPSRAFVTVMLT
jgi:hypothetical protein